uniref:Venom polypeptide n=1 Tax=Dolopus genitalis TaxID=2488630 RepID=A0A3G5BIK0_DOLGE|nr:venom polypeptide [Dolopus genitalis]
MKGFFILVFCVVAISGFNVENEWKKFKATYKKTYKDNTPEGRLRKSNFEETLKLIKAHNDKYETEKKKKNPSVTYKLEIGPFADLSDQEFRRKSTSSKSMKDDQTVCKFKPNKKPKFRAGPIIGKHNPLSGNPPQEVDWSKKLVLSPIQNQGDCGCCWAYASIGAVEAHLTKKTGKFEKLSEQELVECLKTENTDGCDGGMHYEAFDYMIDDGITPAVHYPKTPQEGKCNSGKMKNKKHIQGYRFLDLKKSDEEELKKVIAFIGPVATSMSTPRSIKNYGKNSGVYNDPDCNKYESDHYVLIVGYGVDNGIPYWLIKNSWSAEWGINGYMKLARNQKNLCHIASEAFYPIV